jgi:hypothetical protein
MILPVIFSDEALKVVQKAWLALMTLSYASRITIGLRTEPRISLKK